MDLRNKEGQLPTKTITNDKGQVIALIYGEPNISYLARFMLKNAKKPLGN